MASGSFERPLPDPAEEKALLGLSGINTISYDQNANTTRYIKFPSKPIDGILILSAGAGSGLDSKRGIYVFGSTTTGSVSLTPVLASSLTITGGSNYIAVANGTSHVYWAVIGFMGGQPTVETTQP